MIGVLWNCRGVAKKGISSHLAKILHDYQVDFVGIQETMKKDFSDKFLRKIDWQGKYQWHWLPSVGKSGGILGGVNSWRFNTKGVSMGQFHIKVHVEDMQEKKEL